MEHLPMCPVFQALLVAISTALRSRLSLQLEVIALRHQLCVYQRSAKRLRIQRGDRILWELDLRDDIGMKSSSIRRVRAQPESRDHTGATGFRQINNPPA
jgi:hypothetical protein